MSAPDGEARESHLPPPQPECKHTRARRDRGMGQNA